jgi:hypothetical protein
LASLLAIFGLLILQAYKFAIKEAWMIILTIAILFIPEAPLTMQHGVFLFCFFPLLVAVNPILARITPKHPDK